MTTAFTRICTRSCSCSAVAAFAPAVEQCVICQDDMDNNDEIVELRCQHKFHGRCIVSHLRGDNRCPICRDDPDSDNDPDPAALGYDINDESDDMTPRISVKAALKAAHAAAKTNKNVKKSLETLKKWKNDAKESRHQLKHMYAELRPKEDRIEDKIIAYEKRKWKKFEHKHKQLIGKVKDLRSNLLRAERYAKATKGRLAKKYGA